MLAYNCEHNQYQYATWYIRWHPHNLEKSHTAIIADTDFAAGVGVMFLKHPVLFTRKRD